jgi:Helix-turn-helix domain
MQRHQHPKDFAVFLTEGEAARLLRLSGRTMQRLRRRGLGPPYARLGFRRVVYEHARLIAWANACIETTSAQR